MATKHRLVFSVLLGFTLGMLILSVRSPNFANPSRWDTNWAGRYQITETLGKPTLVSPRDGARTTDNTLTFKWTCSEDADNHRLLVDKSPPDWENCADNVLLGATDNSWQKQAPGYIDDSYSWKVIAIKGGDQQESDTWTFTFLHPIDYVNTLFGVGSGTGTGDDNHSFCYPGVCVPFGTTQWTPQGKAETGGDYVPYRGENLITGFRGSHFPQGSRMKDYASVVINPQAGTLVEYDENARAASMVITDNSPAYFACTIQDDGFEVEVELTATMHSSFFRLTYLENGNAHVLVDAHSDGEVELHASENEIWAKNVQSGHFDGGYSIEGYSVIRFNRSFASSGWDGCLAYATFSVDNGENILVKVGTSFISYEQARTNLDNEIPDWDFDRVRSETRAEWNRELGKIEVEGENESQLTIFYSALYHCMVVPRVFSEGDNYYSAFDNQVHTSLGYQFYNDFSLWDTFRAEHPLLTIIQPARVADMCQSLVDMYEQGGWIPKWPNPGYSSVMIGTHGDSVIADAYLKGITDFDIENAYAALMKNAMVPSTGGYESRAGLEYYKELGYVPADILPVPGSNMSNNEGTSRTLEFAYDDWCIAQLAKALGEEADYELLMERARNYRNVLDSSVGFVRGRNYDGSWSSPFDPLAITTDFTEGNAWQYTWFVPHDVQGLIHLMGGRAEFNQKLDQLFENTDFTAGWQGYYNHANEPSHGAVYLYNWSGEPWKTQKYAREVMEGQYWAPGDRPPFEPNNYPYGYNGLTGNEDCGQMSAWYVFSAMGFYPVCPAQLTYQIGSPIFDRVTIHLDNSYYGGDFVIEAQNVSRDNKYIQSATLNGEPLEKPWFTHSDLAGGHLVFEMGSEPNYSWGSDPEDAPPSMFTVSSLEPENRIPTTDNTPTFKWENYFVADNYEIWVDNDPDFGSSEILENTTDNTYTPNSPLALGDYWWKVRAYKDGESKPFLNTWTFTVVEHPNWWDNNWTRCRPITVGSHPENYQIKVVISSEIPKSDYPSIRFLENETSGLLPYWIERDENEYLNVAWVRRLENSDDIIWMYYKNPGATSAENGNNVFLFFDDFGGGTGGQDALDTSKWSASSTGVDVYEYALRLEDYNNQDGFVEHGPDQNIQFLNTERVIEFRIKNSQTWRGGLTLSGPGSFGGKKEYSEFFNDYWGNLKFFCDGEWSPAGLLQANKWWIGRVDMYSDEKWRARFYWGEDDGSYRQYGWNSGEKTNNWNPDANDSNYCDKYKLHVWDSGGTSSYYYDWFFVRKYTPSEASTTVGDEEFIPDDIPPTAFNLLTPENNATTTNIMPTLTWQASSDNCSGLDHYEVWLDGNNVDNVSDVITIYKVFSLLCESHDWYIVAVDVAGNKQRSENIFTFTILDSGQTISDVPADAILLRDNWAVKSSYLVSENGENISTSSFTPENWYNTFVPSTVLSALVRNGVYPNPYVGMNNMRIPDSSDNFNNDYNLLQYSHIPGRNPWKDPYWYRTTFFIPDNYENKQIWLSFNGINYRADVWLNGQKIADNENMVGMFRQFKFNITDYAEVGENNYLAVRIHPVDYPGVPAPPQTEVLGSFGSNGGDWPNPDGKTIGKNVTMQCSVGWDWIPAVRDRNMGIWQDVYVNATGPVDIRNPHVITDLLDNGSANVMVSAELVNATGSVQTGVLKGSIGDNVTFENNSVEIGPGKTVEVVFSPTNYPQLVIDSPSLWWPNTYGEQYLYNLSLIFENNKVSDNVFDNETTTFGIREITTELSSDNGRVFYVNGERIFLKGGAWVPDMMLNGDSKRYDDEIRLLAEANQTVVRIWGGGITPPDKFFEACDKYGLLVWHDFWITGDCNGRFGGSSDWPLDDNLFLESAIDTVKRIRNHPSLLVWVGGNEWYPRENLYVPLRDNIIAELDGTRPLLLSSDGRVTNPSWENNNPGVYSGGPWYWHDSAYYFNEVRTNDEWTFKDETGSPSLPPLSSIKKFIPDLTPDPDEPFPLNDTWGYHDACENNTGNGRYGVYHDAIVNRYGFPTTLEDYVLKAQLVNADLYRAIFEAANHRMWDRTSGVILWKAQSAWPSVMWQVYDWYLLPNAGYYYTQNACEPLHVQLDDNLSVYVINTYHEPKNNLTVRTEVYDLDMNLVWENTKVVNVGADNYKEIVKIEDPSLTPMYFVSLKMENSDGELVSRNFYWLSETDNFTSLQNLPTVNVNTSVKIENSGDETVVNVTVTNPSDDLAFFICLKVTSDISGEEVLPTYWNSNYFSLLPGENREITATFKTMDLEGNPVVELSGVNVQSQELEISYPPFETPPYFVKYEGNPIMGPVGASWENEKVYNPGVIVDNNTFHMLYRAENGDVTGRIGYAWSTDGINFTRYSGNPVLVPSESYDENGCEDPRLVKLENTYYMTYTGNGGGGNGNVCLAKSDDLKNWTKLGETVQPAHSWNSSQIKAGALVPEKIGGYYYMYYMGENEAWRGKIGLARATDIDNVLTWEDFLDHPVMEPRSGDYFDNTGVEPGAAYVLENAILLIYNGWTPDPDWYEGAPFHQYIHRTGWAKFSKDNLAQLLDRGDDYIIEEYVPSSQNVCFSESICYRDGKWYIHYGMQDKWIGVATYAPPRNIHLTWDQNDTAHTIVVTWQTNESGTGDIVLYDTTSRGGDSALYSYSATGSEHTYPNAGGYVHDVELSGLSPDTTYYFICGGNSGYSYERSFHTAPVTSKTFTFVAGGDSRSGSSDWPDSRNDISRAMAEHNPSFVLHVGDYVYDGETDQNEWDNWLTDVHEHWIENNGLTIPIIPAIGNHEGDGTIYYGQFALPENENWYSLDWGPDLHITVLSTQDSIGGEQLTWLQQDLAAHESTTWKVVVFHEPPYTSAIGHSPRTDIQETWCPVFDQYHVDLVFCGHCHNYERTFPIYSNTVKEDPSEGTVYVVSGGWGAPIHDVGSNWWTAYSQKTYNFVTVEIVEETALHLKAYDRYGNLFDSYDIYKEPSALIYINGDNDFTPANGVTSGSGTENDPYIIENLNIILDPENADAVFVRNTTANFIIRNSRIQGPKPWGGGPNPSNPSWVPWDQAAYESGIRLENVRNGKIENVELTCNYYAIRFDSSENNTIENCFMSLNYDAIWLGDSDNNRISGCTLQSNLNHSISLWSSSHNVVESTTTYNGQANYLYQSSQNTFRNCIVRYNYNGISFSYSPYNTIENCTIENNRASDIGYWETDPDTITYL